MIILILNVHCEEVKNKIGIVTESLLQTCVMVTGWDHGTTGKSRMARLLKNCFGGHRCIWLPKIGPTIWITMTVKHKLMALFSK